MASFEVVGSKTQPPEPQRPRGARLEGGLEEQQRTKGKKKEREKKNLALRGWWGVNARAPATKVRQLPCTRGCICTCTCTCKCTSAQQAQAYPFPPRLARLWLHCRQALQDTTCIVQYRAGRDGEQDRTGLDTPGMARNSWRCSIRYSLGKGPCDPAPSSIITL